MSLHSFLDEEHVLQWFYDNNAAAPATGRTIGYRRVAGKIGLTPNESGTRGAWVDKRVALFKEFGVKNKYKIELLSDTTDETKNDGLLPQYDAKFDILCLEFGGTNLQFYGKDWDKTVNYVKNHAGDVWFICDDPDLSFLWELLPNENWSRWTIIANAVNVQETLKVLKAPEGVKCIHLPMNASMEFDTFSAGTINKIVYIGRNQGRAAYIKTFGTAKSLQIAGKEKEWEDYQFKLVDVPLQKDRRKFYRNYYGCLALYDKKHAVTGWHTGRAYHALYAGIPVLAPLGNKGLEWCYPVNTAEDLDKFVLLSVEERKKIWEQQCDSIL